MKPLKDTLKEGGAVMRTSTMVSAAILAVSLWAVAGCCGDVESKLNKCKKSLAATVEKLDNAEANGVKLSRLLDGVKTKLSEAEDQNKFLTKRLLSLGQDVKSLKEKRALTEEEKARLAERLAQTKRQMEELQQRQAQAEARIRQFRDLLRQFAAMIKAGKIKVTVRDGRMVVQLPDKVLFKSGRADLKSEGQKALEMVTKILMTVKNRNFQVAGHTDNEPIKTRRFPTNWELSVVRAVNVAKYMQKLGMDPKRLSAAGYAEFSPAASNDTAEGKAENRRIEIVLLPNLSELPSLEGLLPGAK